MPLATTKNRELWPVTCLFLSLETASRYRAVQLWWQRKGRPILGFKFKSMVTKKKKDTIFFRTFSGEQIFARFVVCLFFVVVFVIPKYPKVIRSSPVNTAELVVLWGRSLWTVQGFSRTTPIRTNVLQYWEFFDLGPCIYTCILSLGYTLSEPASTLKGMNNLVPKPSLAFINPTTERPYTWQSLFLKRETGAYGWYDPSTPQGPQASLVLNYPRVLREENSPSQEGSLLLTVL